MVFPSQGVPFSREEEEYIIYLKEQQNPTPNWAELTTQFHERFPNSHRSKGGLQVHYSRSLQPSAREKKALRRTNNTNGNAGAASGGGNDRDFSSSTAPVRNQTQAVDPSTGSDAVSSSQQPLHSRSQPQDSQTTTDAAVPSENLENTVNNPSSDSYFSNKAKSLSASGRESRKKAKRSYVQFAEDYESEGNEDELTATPKAKSKAKPKADPKVKPKAKSNANTKAKSKAQQSNIQTGVDAPSDLAKNQSIVDTSVPTKPVSKKRKIETTICDKGQNAVDSGPVPSEVGSKKRKREATDCGEEQDIVDRAPVPSKAGSKKTKLETTARGKKQVSFALPKGQSKKAKVESKKPTAVPATRPNTRSQSGPLTAAMEDSRPKRQTNAGNGRAGRKGSKVEWILVDPPNCPDLQEGKHVPNVFKNPPPNRVIEYSARSGSYRCRSRREGDPPYVPPAEEEAASPGHDSNATISDEDATTGNAETTGEDKS